MSALAGSAIDVDVATFVLDVVDKRLSALDVHVESSITDGTIERTMDGASTLTVTVHDPHRVLLRSGMFSYAIDAKLDRYFFRLVQVQKQDDDLTLTFEDRAVAALRAKTGVRKAQRADVTRAEFALSLVREVTPAIPFVCPQLHTKQPIAGTTAKADTRAVRKALPFQFRRGSIDGKQENSWDCLKRLAEDVKWRCFVSAGSLYFISEDDLLTAAPRMTVTETDASVFNVDFDIDNGKPSSEATVYARAARWAAGPGDVVKLSDCGPADGMWLVYNVRRGLFDANATITLKRVTHALPEPRAASPLSIGGKTSGKAAAAAGMSGAVATAYEAAQSIGAKNYPYSWGGGHGPAGVPGGSPPGYDCSGAVSAVIAAAEMGTRLGGTSFTSVTLASWGVAGRGEYITVYTNPVHAFMVFHTAQGDQHFGTGHWGTSEGGAGFKPTMHTTEGFQARHWPGT